MAGGGRYIEKVNKRFTRAAIVSCPGLGDTWLWVTRLTRFYLVSTWEEFLVSEREEKVNSSRGPPGTDRKQKLQESKITHVLSIHDHAEPEYTVSQYSP